MAALTGNLKIRATDGTILEDRTDVDLAWKWAKHEVTLNAPAEFGPKDEFWGKIPFQIQRMIHEEALRALRETYVVAGIIEAMMTGSEGGDIQVIRLAPPTQGQEGLEWENG